MGTTLGSIDERYRPLLRIELPGDRGGFLALLDTGFNGELHCERSTAVQLGVTPLSEPVKTQLAGGVEQWAQFGQLDIVWMSRHRRVQVLVAIAEATTLRDGDPTVLVGGGLLAPSLVLLDYGARLVEIEDQE